jgi:hypothetical protein
MPVVDSHVGRIRVFGGEKTLSASELRSKHRRESEKTHNVINASRKTIVNKRQSNITAVGPSRKGLTRCRSFRTFMPRWRDILQVRVENAIRQTAAENIDLNLADEDKAKAALDAVMKGAAAAGLKSPASVVSRNSGEALSEIPKTWGEAKAQVPGLMKWAEAKAVRPDLTIIDHLRDQEVGYGRWTQQAPGLPRPRLLHIDEPAYASLARWLSRSGHELPPDLYLPTKSQIIRTELTPERLRDAYRITGAVRRDQTRERTRGRWRGEG